MTDESEILIRPEDFQSTHLSLVFKNLTTKTEVKHAESSGIVEVGDKALVLELPLRSCNTQHSAMLSVFKYDHTQKKYNELISMTGKVLSVEDIDGEALRVEFSVKQVDEEGWQSFLASFSDRQKEIDNLLKSMRGW